MLLGGYIWDTLFEFVKVTFQVKDQFYSRVQSTVFLILDLTYMDSWYINNANDLFFFALGLKQNWGTTFGV
jgi:hypothetical protein